MRMSVQERRTRLAVRHRLAPVARASDGAIPAVRGLDDDVWLREGGLLRVSTSRAQDAILDRSLAAARELGVEEEAVHLSADTLSRHCSSTMASNSSSLLLK